MPVVNILAQDVLNTTTREIARRMKVALSQLSKSCPILGQKTFLFLRGVLSLADTLMQSLRFWKLTKYFLAFETLQPEAYVRKLIRAIRTPEITVMYLAPPRALNIHGGVKHDLDTWSYAKPTTDAAHVHNNLNTVRHEIRVALTVVSNRGNMRSGEDRRRRAYRSHWSQNIRDLPQPLLTESVHRLIQLSFVFIYISLRAHTTAWSYVLDVRFGGRCLLPIAEPVRTWSEPWTFTEPQAITENITKHICK